MTEQQYKDQRKKKLDEAEALIKKENYDEANRIMDGVEGLDEAWEATDASRVELANARALSDDQPIPDVVRDMYGNGAVNLTNGKVYPASRKASTLYLNSNNTMVSRAMAAGADPSPLSDPDALGNTVRGIVTGKWSSDVLKNAVTTSTTGAIIPEVLSAQVIDLARDLSLFTAAGVPVTPMATNNLKISRIKEDPVFGFKAEGEEGAEVDLKLDSVKLESRTCYGFCHVSLEAIQSSENLTAILESTFAQAIAQAIDNGMMYGGGEAAPAGIMNDTDIITLEATGEAYNDFIKAQAAIRQNNYEPSVWAVNAFTDENLSLLTDNEGRYLDVPPVLSGMRKIVSNQLNHDDSDGSDALVFVPDSMLIGIQNDIRIKIIEDEKALKNGMVGFQIYSMLDAKVIRPKAICRITGLK